MNAALHVFPYAGCWSLRKTGARRALARFGSRELALSRATALADSDGRVLYVHDHSGRIQSRREPANG